MACRQGAAAAVVGAAAGQIAGQLLGQVVADLDWVNQYLDEIANVLPTGSTLDTDVSLKEILGESAALIGFGVIGCKIAQKPFARIPITGSRKVSGMLAITLRSLRKSGRAKLKLAFALNAGFFAGLASSKLLPIGYE